MTSRDLQELEKAAGAIVTVIERNRVSDEAAEERRKLFKFVFKEKEEISNRNGKGVKKV